MENSLIGVKKMTWILRALILAYLTTILALLALAFGLYKFDFSEEIVQGGIIAIYILSAFVGGRAVGKQAKVRRFFWGMIVGIFYFLLLLAISLLVYRNASLGDGMITSFLLCLAGGMLGGMVS